MARAENSGSSPARPSRGSGSVGPTPRAPISAPVEAAIRIVLNCPDCGRRYEVDAALAGKKSRCKDCGKVFSIPGQAGLVADKSRGERPSPQIATAPPRKRQWESVLDDEPTSLKASRGPAGIIDDDLPLPPPPRAGYATRAYKPSYQSSHGNNPDVGITIAGLYILLLIVVGLGFWIWMSAAEPTPERQGQIFALATLFLHGIACFLGFSGWIWVLVLAFRERLEQGLLCMLVPCYQFYYICTRWEDTRGAFTLKMLPLLNIVLLVVVGAGIRGISQATAEEGSSIEASATETREPASGPKRRGPTANRFKVEEAERRFQDYKRSIDQVTNSLVNAQRPGANVAALHHLSMSANMAEFAEARTKHVNLTRNEWTALKHRVGADLIGSLGALKSEMLRIESQPDMRGAFGDGPQLIDKEIAFWTLQGDEQVVPELEDGPEPPLGRMHVPGEPPPGFGMPRGGGGPRFRNPGDPNPADPNYQFQRFNAEHGERSVTIMFRGMPNNPDPSVGVTDRDVSDAVQKRLRELAPQASNFMWMGQGGKSALMLSPVDDIPGLARRVDFGKATVKGKQIEIELSPDYVASVPRLPAEPAPRPGGAGRGGRNNEPEFPPDADAVTRSLIQLKSSETHKKKEGLSRLERTTPDNRLAEVVGAVLPLLDDDDGWLVGDAIKVLAIWKSPDAVPALINRTSDNRGGVRHEAIKALAKIKDPRGVEAIVVRIKEDGFQVEDALKEMGSMAEQALIERLTNPDSGVRRRVCEILKAIGGKEALKAMNALPADPDFGVRIAAKDAMSSIMLRVGPLSPAEKRNRSSTGGQPKKGPKP